MVRAIDLIKFCGDILKSLSEVGISSDDYRHVEMYDDYEEMVRRGEKKEYIKAYLAEKYGTSKSSVYRIVTRLGRQVRM